MWPFRNLQQRIDALEDQLADKTAQVQTIHVACKNVTAVPTYYVDKAVILNGEIAVLESKLARLRAMKGPKRG